MKGCLLVPVAMMVSLALGIAATALFQFVTGQAEPATTVGTGVWLFSFFLILPYGSLWLSDPQDLMVPSASTSAVQQWRDAKAESKLQSAELRFGLAFALIGGGLATVADSPNYVVALVVISCAMAGILVGFDYKRRVLRMRERANSTVPQKDEKPNGEA